MISSFSFHSETIPVFPLRAPLIGEADHLVTCGEFASPSYFAYNFYNLLSYKHKYIHPRDTLEILFTDSLGQLVQLCGEERPHSLLLPASHSHTHMFPCKHSYHTHIHAFQKHRRFLGTVT